MNLHFVWPSLYFHGDRCQARLGIKKALSLCFSLNADELLAAGHKHFKVWTLSGGGLMQGKRGLFGSGSKVREANHPVG